MNVLLNLAQKVLICISHPAHAPMLIAQGASLIGAFREASGVVVHIRCKPYDDYEWVDFSSRQLFMSRCTYHGLAFEEVEQGNETVGEVLCRLVRDRQITQIVLGQAPRGRIAGLFAEPLSNQLLKLHPNAGLHIVDISSCMEVKEEFFSGVTAWLIEENGLWTLRQDGGGSSSIKGIFFRSAFTDFDNGFFVSTRDSHSDVLEVADGVAVMPPHSNAEKD